jgi:hypothetical protein
VAVPWDLYRLQSKKHRYKRRIAYKFLQGVSSVVHDSEREKEVFVLPWCLSSTYKTRSLRFIQYERALWPIYRQSPMKLSLPLALGGHGRSERSGTPTRGTSLTQTRRRSGKKNVDPEELHGREKETLRQKIALFELQAEKRSHVDKTNDHSEALHERDKESLRQQIASLEGQAEKRRVRITTERYKKFAEQVKMRMLASRRKSRAV